MSEENKAFEALKKFDEVVKDARVLEPLGNDPKPIIVYGWERPLTADEIAQTNQILRDVYGIKYTTIHAPASDEGVKRDEATEI